MRLVTNNLGKPRFRRKRHKSPVTIITLTACNEFMVVASDSRTTRPDGTISDDVVKIAVVGNSKQQGLIGQAGNSELASRALELILEGGGKMDTSRRAIPDLAEKAVAEVKRQIRDQFKGSAEELQRHFSDYDFELLIAFYYNDVPSIYTLDFLSGLAVSRSDSWGGKCICRVSIGCGAPLANFLYGSFGGQIRTTSPGKEITMALYVVEQIKKFDPRCGGKTRVGLIYKPEGKPNWRAGLFVQSATDASVDVIRDSEPLFRAQWSRLYSAIRKRCMRRMLQVEREHKRTKQAY